MKDIIFFDYREFIKNIIDWSIYIPIASFFVLISLFLQLGYVHCPEYEYIPFLGLLMSPLLSRKLFWGIFYFFELQNFTTTLSSKIENRDDFKKAWTLYYQICKTNDYNRMKTGGIYIRYYLLQLIVCRRLKKLQISQAKNEIQDIHFKENLLFWAFTCNACKYGWSYDFQQHEDIANKLTEGQINKMMEPVLMHIIEECHNDGEGFLSTLTLMQTIMIYLRLQDEKQKTSLEFFKSISDHKIGWLNRKIFEVVIGTVMIKPLPQEELSKLKIELRNEEKNLQNKKWDQRDKWNFRKKLDEKLYNMELEIPP